MNRWSPYFSSILRIIAAFVYGVHGTQKLFGFPAPFSVPHLLPLFLAGGMIETFGGLLY
jgi:putative oxidoreductase